MSQIPPDLGTDNNRRHIVDYDELIALFVAFLTLGSVLFWGLTRAGVNLFGNAGLFGNEDAPSLIGALDSGSLLGTDADDTVAIIEEDDVIGFGAAEAIGAAGAGSILGDLSQATESAATTIVPPAILEAPEEEPVSTAAPIPSAPTTTEPAPVPEVEEAPAAAPLEVTREAIKFSDVPDDFWAKPYIDALSERDVFDGNIVDGVAEDGTFKPNEPISRAQLARAITKAFPLSEEEAALNFSDVSSDFWALEFINEAVKGGYMNGFPDGTFKPEMPVPRAQALTAMVTGSNASVEGDASDVVQRYTDSASIADWAVPKVAAATQAGLVVNHPQLDTLNPNEAATRAEVAAMIYQTLVAQGRIEPIAGEYVVKP